MDNIENNQANYEFHENVFGDFDNGDIPNIVNYDHNFDVNINVLMPIMNEAINYVMNDEPDQIHIICEMTEEVPLRKKPRLHFTYEDIEN
jgi:hypothetical protein